MVKFLAVVNFYPTTLNPCQFGVFSKSIGDIYCKSRNGSIGCFIFKTNQGTNNGCAYIIESGASKARRVCGADNSNDDEPISTLQHGKSINSKGGLHQSVAGMWCVNKAGKGFRLSRAKQNLF